MATSLPSNVAWAGIDSEPLSFLVENKERFLHEHWEKGPAVFKASAARRQLFSDLFSYRELLRLARICEQEGETLEFGVDVNAARYMNGARETPNGEFADAGTIEQLYSKEGCTMQFHQPQRFVDELWRLMAALERQLGCLVGCNAYLTPAGTQGLAPHWDDVELFVIQTEGSKRWRLYRPSPDGSSAGAGGAHSVLQRSHLANHVSGDLAQGDIGEPIMEVVLEVGDVLYLPRGTIHQAAAQAEGSSHLTISTYQRWSTADLLQYTVSVALANAQLQPLLPLPLKAGLPLGWLSAAAMSGREAGALAAVAGGFGPDTPAFPGGASSKPGSRALLAVQLAAACRSMAESLEDAELGGRLLLTAGDAMAEDYMRSRLPPHPEQLPALGPPPTLCDSVQCVGSTYFRLVAFNGTDEHGCGSDCDEEHDHDHAHSDGQAPGASPHQPPAWVRLVSCLRNERGTHMMGGGKDEEEAGEGSGSEDDTGSEMASDEADEALPGIGKAIAAAAAKSAASRKRKHVDAAAAEILPDKREGEEEDGSDEEGDGGSDDDDEEEDEDEQAQEDLVFPAEFAPALVQLLGSAPDAAASGGSGAPVRVCDIALPDPALRVQVAQALWDAGVLCTVQAEPKPKQKKAAKQQQQQQRGKESGSGKQQKKENAAKAAGPPPNAKKHKARK